MKRAFFYIIMLAFFALLFTTSSFGQRTGGGDWNAVSKPRTTVQKVVPGEQTSGPKVLFSKKPVAIKKNDSLKRPPRHSIIRPLPSTLRAAAIRNARVKAGVRITQAHNANPSPDVLLTPAHPIVGTNYVAYDNVSTEMNAGFGLAWYKDIFLPSGKYHFLFSFETVPGATYLLDFSVTTRCGGLLGGCEGLPWRLTGAVSGIYEPANGHILGAFTAVHNRSNIQIAPQLRQAIGMQFNAFFTRCELTRIN